MKKKSKIIILGAGPSSMITALALAHYKIPCIILEKKHIDQKFCYDPRNFALTEYSIEFFKQINIWENIKEYLVRLDVVYIADNRSDEILELKSDLSKFNNLGYMIKASDLKSSLLNLLIKNPLITINSGISYKDVQFNEINDDMSSIIMDNDDKVEADLIIVGDGKYSIFKKRYFKESIYHDYNQKALIFDIEHQKPHSNTALEHFLPNGVTALLPLLDQRKSSIVLVENSDCADILARMNKEELLAYLYERIGYAYGKVQIISELSSYPLSASFTDRYYFKNLVLISDAAHSIHPLSGQGLNQGIKDIRALTDLIKDNAELGIEIDGTMLSKYENLRKADNIKMFRVTHYLDMIFSNNIPILSGSRKIALSLINKFEPLKKIIIRNAMSL
jgi:2-octaprenyl-6-methoxyphenol hydroxylase